jgi:RNA polymerase sigma-70 factor (ECF subfamily)
MSEEPRWNPAACLARIARHDPDAARELVEHCHDLVWKLVRAHRSRSIPDEDLVQEVFLKMFSRLDRYEPRDGIPFEHWLSRLAVRTCLDALRTDRRRPQPADPPLSQTAGEWLETLRRDDASPPIDDVLAARELVDALLARLPPKDRLVLTLLDIDERSVAEVSAITGWSPTLVKVRAFRARRRLRVIVEKPR